MDSQQAWQAAIGQLQMEMSKASYDTWVRSSELIAYEETRFALAGQMPMPASGLTLG
jgi:chromosomal replication initiator protein